MQSALGLLLGVGKFALFHFSYFSIDQSFYSSEAGSSTTFDLSGLAAAVDLYDHVDFDIPVAAVVPQDDDDRDADGEADPDVND